MIDLTIDPPSVAAEVSRIVTVRLGNPDARACTNVIVRLDVPPDLGLEQGRSWLELDRLVSRGVHEHALRIRPSRPGRFTIGVPNFSFRNGYGQSRRERDRSIEMVVEPASERLVVPPSSAGSHATRPPRRPSVFVSYRRSDSKMFVPGLVRDLGRRRNLRHVDLFLDLQGIKPGEVWPEVLDRELRECEMLIAVIGPDWLSAADDYGCRIDHPDDHVRREIATALVRGIPLIPLLIETQMPTAVDLPPDIHLLTTWQGFTFDLAHYGRGVDDLAKRVDALLASAFAS